MKRILKKFHSLATGTDEITGVCYRCDEEGPSTFTWRDQSSCTVTIAGMPTPKYQLLTLNLKP